MVRSLGQDDPVLTMSDQTPRDHDPENEHEPGAEQPRDGEQQADAEQPRDGEQRPDAEQPAAEHEVGAEPPTTEQPGAEPPTTEQPGAEPPTTEQPAPERPTIEQPTVAAPPPRRLYRARDDRVLAGVCGGIAKYFNIDPVLVRVGAVALVFLGGAGLLAYVAAFLLIPNEGEGGGAPVDGPNRAMAIAGVVLLVIAVGVLLPFRGWGPGWGIVPLGFLALAGLLVWRLASGQRPEGDARAILRAMALGIALLVACGILAFSAAWATAAGGDGVVAGIVIAAGIALIAGAFVGQWARWLILPALAVALPAGVVSAAGIDVKGGYGEKTYRPANAEAVRDSYRVGAGHLVVDLRRAQLTPGDHHIKLRVGVGEADLIVPRGVCVSTDAHLGIGGVNVFDTTNGGIDHDWTDERDALPGSPRVVLDSDIGIGAVTVHHRPYEHWEKETGNGACA
jgi:phage shock protein PspC (stress-responsive transcriptional regulator)